MNKTIKKKRLLIGLGVVSLYCLIAAVDGSHSTEVGTSYLLIGWVLGSWTEEWLQNKYGSKK